MVAVVGMAKAVEAVAVDLLLFADAASVLSKVSPWVDLLHVWIDCKHLDYLISLTIKNPHQITVFELASSFVVVRMYFVSDSLMNPATTAMETFE